MNMGLAQEYCNSLHIHTYIHTYTYIHAYMHTYIHTYTHIHTYTYIYIHIHTYTYIHIHTHTYTYIYIHTYIHTNILYIHPSICHAFLVVACCFCWSSLFFSRSVPLDRLQFSATWICWCVPRMTWGLQVGFLVALAMETLW